MISIEDQATAGTRIYSHVKRHHLPMMTTAAILTRIGRIDLHKLFFPKAARVFNLFTRRQGGKRFESYINPHLGRHIRQTMSVAFDREAGVPLARATLVDGKGFNPASDGAMVDHHDTAHFGQADTVVMRDGKARLWEGETIVSVTASEAGVSWRLASFHSSEECLERQVNPYRNILQDLRVDSFQGRTFLFQSPKGVDLVIQGKPFAFLFPSITPFFKQVVIEPTAFIKHAGELLRLLFGWVDSVLKHFMHLSIVAQSRTYVKKGAALSSRPMNGGESSRAVLIRR